jgi:uncharacterized protein YcbK (DUF882 family)
VLVGRSDALVVDGRQDRAPAIVCFLGMGVRIDGVQINMERYQYFTEEEVKGLQPQFAMRLEQARHAAGVSFVLTSTLRTSQQNKDCGGVEDSSHEKGMAVDIAAADSMTRFHILKGLMAVGISRIGVYDRHIHADADSSKPQCVMWTGISH